MKLIRLFLYPFSILYGVAVLIRNILYALDIFGSKRYGISIISIGNLRTGGTGKSPMVSYIASVLSPLFGTGILSRGYGRTTRGYCEVNVHQEYAQVGDEAYMIKRWHPDIPVVVCEDRRKGIEHFIEKMPDIEVLLLDDAFQHRRIEPGINILLTCYSDLYIHDHLLPSGNLREFRSGAKRADIIIVTKCPRNFTGMECRLIAEQLKPLPHQKIFFAGMEYGDFVPVYHMDNLFGKDYYYERNYRCLLITGIAQPDILYYHLKSKFAEIKHLKFRDHHEFTINDAQKIKTAWDKMPTEKKLIVTTEKDAVRLQAAHVKEAMKDLPVFYLPVHTVFNEPDGTTFNELITEYVRKNQINRKVNTKQNR